MKVHQIHYSPSNSLVRSKTCRGSSIRQLSCRKLHLASFHGFQHVTLVTKPIDIGSALSLARFKKFKILRVKTITQGKCKSLVENIISYETSYWGMSTLALPVFLTIQSNFAISKSSWFLSVWPSLCANSVISKPCHFELFFMSSGTSK